MKLFQETIKRVQIFNYVNVRMYDTDMDEMTRASLSLPTRVSGCWSGSHIFLSPGRGSVPLVATASSGLDCCGHSLVAFGELQDGKNNYDFWLVVLPFVGLIGMTVWEESGYVGSRAVTPCF